MRFPGKIDAFRRRSPLLAAMPGVSRPSLAFDPASLLSGLLVLLGDDENDLSGNGNHFAVTGTPSPAVGGGVTFPSGSYYERTRVVTSGQFAFAMSFRPETVSGDSSLVFLTDTGAVGPHALTNADDGTSMDGQRGSDIVSDSAAASAGTFRHYVFQYDGTNLYLYSNGVLRNTTLRVYAGSFTGSDTIRLGGPQVNDVTVKNFMILNRPLTAPEIAYVAAGGIPPV